MTLKKSEKILLQILIVVAGFAALWMFLLMPELEKKLSITEEHDALETEYLQKQTLLLNTALDQRYADEKELAEENYDYFYAVLNGYTIDGIVNGIAQERNLSIESLNIGSYEEASGDFEAETGKKLDVLVKSIVSLSVKGNYEDILQFVDDMNAKSPCLRMSTVSISENSSDATGEKQMTASFRIYLYGIDVDLPELTSEQ